MEDKKSNLPQSPGQAPTPVSGGPEGKASPKTSVSSSPPSSSDGPAKDAPKQEGEKTAASPKPPVGPAGGPPVSQSPDKPGTPASPAAAGGPSKPAASSAGRPSPLGPGRRPIPSFKELGFLGMVKKYKFVAMAAFLVVGGGGMWATVKVYKAVFSKSDKKKKKDKAGGPQEAMAVNALEVKADRFQDTLVAVGTIAGGSEIPLRFEVDGPVDYFEFREGDKVRKGDIIARLNQRDAYLKMKRAELELDQYEKLYAIGGVARGRLEEARLAADLARSELEKTVLRAPRDGILGDKDAEVGEFITPNKKIATLVNIETVVVRVGIIEKEIDKVFPGQKVMLTVDTYPGVEFTGRVENISPLVQGTSKTLTVEARLDNEGGLLLPGMFARTRIVIFEEDNAIVVPNDSLEKTQTGFRLFVVTKDNKAEARDVEVGYVSSQFSQITGGLSPGELVVTQKPQDLKPGTPVKVIEVQK